MSSSSASAFAGFRFPRDTVPAGWANYEDLYGNFLLVPRRGTLKGVNADTGDFIGVFRSAPAAATCDHDGSVALRERVAWLNGRTSGSQMASASSSNAAGSR